MNSKAQLGDLVALYIEGRCGPDELKELESRLLEDAGSREYFLDMVLLDQDLGILGGSRQARLGASPLPIHVILQRQRTRAVKFSLLAAAAMVLISMVTLWLIMAPRHPATLAEFRVAPESSFTLTHAGVGEEPAGMVLAKGSRIEIEHGVVELMLPRGVRAVTEAPASLTLLDEQTLHLGRGRAFFEVSSQEGRGFTVVTPHQRIVDLGTAFGIDTRMDRDGVDLHVFEGRVRVDSPDGKQGEIFTAPRSVTLSGARVREELKGPPAVFRRELPPKIETLLHEDFESGLVGGREYSVVIDPTVIRDLEGNQFAGIAESRPWNFRSSFMVAEPVSFHDLGGEPSPGHITTQRSLDESVDLVSLADGSDTGIQFRIENAIMIDVLKTTRTPASNTPAGKLFLGSGIDLNQGFITDSALKSPKPARFVFSGLNPDLRYDIALYGERDLPPDGRERFTLKGAERADNLSSTGVVGTFVTEIETRANAAVGHVVRWAGIDPGDDGTVTIEIDPSVSGHQNIAYLSGVRMAVTGIDGTPVNFDGSRFAGSGYASGAELPDLRDLPLGPDPRDPENDGASPSPDEGDGLSADGRDTIPPVIVFRYPADGSSDALPGERLTVIFSEPVELGTGRIFLRNVTDWTETSIPVGDPRLSVEGRVLTIAPPAELRDGEMQLGRIGGWESHDRVGTFNPAGKGTWYGDERLMDKNGGVIGSMLGSVMATFGECRPGARFGRELGTIAPDSRYTVSAAIGVRASASAGNDPFDGYSIRLTSRGTTLAVLSSDQPPGPPNSVSSVGFSWDSSDLPDGVAPGDPLAIEIAPNQASGKAPGYLDLDNVRVTVVAR